MTQRAFEAVANWISRRTRLLIVAPHDHTIGNCAEEIFYGTVFARLTGKRLLILRRWSILGFPRIGNVPLFRAVTDRTLGEPARSSLAFLGNALLTLTAGHLPAVVSVTFINLGRALRHGFRLGVGLVSTTHGVTLAALRAHGRAPWSFGRSTFRSGFKYVRVGTQLIWNLDDARAFSWPAVHADRWTPELRVGARAELPPDQEALGRAALARLGVPADAWWVCLHVREGGYHRDPGAARNSTPARAQLAIDEVIRRGGWVIRLGDPSMTRLPPRPGFVDYPFTPEKSETVDLFLIRHCRLYIGQNSGILDCASLYHRQIALINASEWSIGFPLLPGSRVLPKHIYCRRRERVLTVSELLDEPFEWQDLHRFRGGYEFRENTPEEILDVVVEALDWRPGAALTPLQEEFRRRRERQIRGWLDGPPLWDRRADDLAGKFRIAVRVQASEATLGRKFLEARWG